jgi:6-phosphogluconolactonase
MHPTLTPLILAFMGLAASAGAAPESCWVYFGTQTTDARSGIYRSRLDLQTGALSPAVRITDRPNSVFMAFSPDQTRLYCLAEPVGPSGKPTETVETYQVDRRTGDLLRLGERFADGSEACHISVDPSGRCVLTTNYGAHYVEAFPVLSDGTVGERSSLVRHSGSGPNRDRQESAHPHSVNVDPSGRFAVVADLGLDRLYVYRLDPAAATLSPNSPAFCQMAPGSGPRHFSFHPDGRHAFVINELQGSVTALIWDGQSGTLTPYQTVSILRKEYVGLNTSAEVVVSKSGRFVYGSNRGDDSIVVLSFDPVAGRLAFVQRMADGVKVPRNYAIDPTGRWLVCANLTADTATVYRVDPESGRLSLSGSIAVPEALCVRFLED